MKVAKVIDEHQVAITGGSESGREVGDYLTISEPIIDPETGENIGDYPNLTVRVEQVFPKFVVAETVPLGQQTRLTVTVNIGDNVGMAT